MSMQALIDNMRADLARLEELAQGCEVEPTPPPEPLDGFRYFYPPADAGPDNTRFHPVVWGPNTPAQPAITDDDLRKYAARWSVPYCHLKAVLAVESAGSGFLLNEPAPARPKILFEAHIFYRESGSVPVSQTRPDLSSPHWDRSLYKGGSLEWDRLHDAMEFHETGALRSASWGLGQVMGFNHEAAGCPTIERFVEEAYSGEAAQFGHMLNFINNNGLMPALRAGDWHTFARGYNGSSYAAHGYHTRLAEAAAKC